MALTINGVPWRKGQLNHRGLGSRDDPTAMKDRMPLQWRPCKPEPNNHERQDKKHQPLDLSQKPRKNKYYKNENRNARDHKRPNPEREIHKTNLSFIEHWDLNEDHREIGAAHFKVFLQWLEFVTLFWFLPEELNEDYDNPHVDPLNEEHQRHDQASVNPKSQNGHYQWRFD